jgi:hypothetical protein
MRLIRHITGADYHLKVAITVELESNYSRDETNKVMDGLVQAAMKMFQHPEVPRLFVALGRLKVK